MNQITVELLDNKNDDLFVVNAARVSFNKWQDTFEPKDKGLLSYLAKHKHTSPFRHIRFTFFIPYDDAIIRTLTLLNPFDKAGMVVCAATLNNKFGIIIKNSFFGWVNTIHHFPFYVQDNIKYYLSQFVHNCCSVYNIKNGLTTPYESVVYIDERHLRTFNNPWLIDYSFRCKVPIWLSRQLAKHQITMSWNEVSRRYVDTPPELFDQELRYKPEGSIKQGSGAIVEPRYEPTVDLGYGTCNINTANKILLKWYELCVDSNIAPETIRGYMPQNMMTEFIWTGSLPAFQHMIALRKDSHAQKEAQYFATLIEELINKDTPL